MSEYVAIIYDNVAEETVISKLVGEDSLDSFLVGYINEGYKILSEDEAYELQYCYLAEHTNEQGCVLVIKKVAVNE